MRNPGQIIRLGDGRLCRIDNKQPLFETKGFIIINLIDDNYKPILDDKGKPKMLLRTESGYKDVMKDAKLIGYVD